LTHIKDSRVRFRAAFRIFPVGGGVANEGLGADGGGTQPGFTGEEPNYHCT
jgi:hypothetical protein